MSSEEAEDFKEMIAEQRKRSPRSKINEGSIALYNHCVSHEKNEQYESRRVAQK